MENPITNEADISFVKAEINDLLAKAQTVPQRQGVENPPPTRKIWEGPAPHCRLLHAITDVPENKAALIDSFRVLTREELDGRRNS